MSETKTSVRITFANSTPTRKPAPSNKKINWDSDQFHSLPLPLPLKKKALFRTRPRTKENDDRKGPCIVIAVCRRVKGILLLQSRAGGVSAASLAVQGYRLPASVWYPPAIRSRPRRSILASRNAAPIYSFRLLRQTPPTMRVDDTRGISRARGVRTVPYITKQQPPLCCGA